LRAELVSVISARDAALRKEEAAKELVGNLLDEVSLLRGQVRPCTLWLAHRPHRSPRAVIDALLTL
jgi:hypothetical protein